MAEQVQKSDYGSGAVNTRANAAGGKALPPLTHSLRAAEGYEDSKGYIPDTYIRAVEGKYGQSLKINVPEGKTVTLTAGTYYINPRKMG